MHGRAEHAGDLERLRRGLDNNGYNMEYVNTAPGTVAGIAELRFVLGDVVAAPDCDGAVRGPVLGRRHPRRHRTNGGPTPAAAPNAAARNLVGFQVPGASAYTTITASQVDNSPSPNTSRYGAFADVTSMVQAAGAGTYSVANVQAGTGGDRYAGWTLVVAYQDPTQPPRNLTVDDGFVTVQSGSPPITIPVSGFRTPPSGPVRTTLGFVAYEGDAGLTGDSATLNTTKLSDPGSPANNFFDSAISEPGRERHHAGSQRPQQLGL